MTKRLVIITTMLLTSLAITHDLGGQDANTRIRAHAKKPRNVELQGEQNIENGFVFIDSQYIPTPYRIDYNETQLFLNDFPFDLAVFESLSDKDKKRRLEGRETRRIARRLSDLLECEFSIVLFSGKPVEVVLRGVLLSILVNDKASTEFSIAASKKRLTSNAADPQVWEDFVRSFDCPPELRVRANAYLTRVKEIRETNGAQASAKLAEESARRMVESSSYPLTVIGMLLVAVAFGHLLSFMPGNSAQLAIDSDAQRACGFSLTLLAAMSALDLIWTILASRAGNLKELNPIGAALIDDPVSLILLKIAATMIAVVLLFALRQHHAAQKGAWWVCLICTLLTARWLTFNSLFT